MIGKIARPGARSVRLVSALAGVAGVATSAAVVWHASYSAFSATTDNPTNNWATGSVALTDDDSSTAMFNVSNLKPGATGSKCIAVTSNGTLASTVKLYGTNYNTTNSLASNLDLTITQGNGGGFGSCTGFTALGTGATVYSGTLASFGTSATGFANGSGNWAPTGTVGESRTFQFTWTVQSGTPNSAQNGTAALGFTWEAQNS
jgi:hypothetical protein